jgi:multiple sugar transport system permease protein
MADASARLTGAVGHGPGGAAATGGVPVFRRSRSARLRDHWGSFLFVVPFLLFFTAFTLWPMVYAFWVSLHSWMTISGDQGFQGFGHYYNLLFNASTYSSVQAFWDGMENTAFFAIISVPMIVVIAFIFALLLASAPLRTFFRALYYVPAVLSVAVAMTVWLWILQNQGIASTYFHVDWPWLIQQPYAWISIFVATLWWTPGFNMVVLLAGILGVPIDFHEAARIDGANALQRVWYVTIPLLRPVLAFVVITQMIASFGLFGQAFILTHGGPGTGGPGTSTTPVALAMYNEAFGADQNLGLAAAESFLLGAILVILAIIQLIIFRPTDQ